MKALRLINFQSNSLQRLRMLASQIMFLNNIICKVFFDYEIFEEVSLISGTNVEAEQIYFSCASSTFKVLFNCLTESIVSII